MTEAEVAGLALLSVGVTLLVVVLLRIASPRALVDYPNQRSSHVRPRLRGAGLAFVVALVLATVALRFVDAGVGSLLSQVVAPISIVAAVGLADDIRSLPARLRLGVQLFASGWLAWNVGAFAVLAVPVAGNLAVPVTGVVLSLVWCVGLTNAYNFADGIDGIALTQAAVASAAWLLIAVHVHDDRAIAIATVIGASSIAMLPFNWSPARVFIGDVGSNTLGLGFAALPLVVHRGGDGPAWPAAAGVLILWPFVFDTGFTIVRRAVEGANVFEAHRTHLYQRLVGAGWSHRETSGLYGALGVVNASAAMALAWGASWAAPAAWCSAVATAVALRALVATAERRTGARLSSKVTPTRGAFPSGS